MMIRLVLLAVLVFGLFSPSFSQSSETAQDWFRQNATGTYLGTGTDRALAELLSEQTPKDVVVAVIDSGVDIEHEDLKNRLWTNENEIPGNGIDDDNNGYIDDVHGWSFLCSDSEDLAFANLEFTRIYKQLHQRYKDVSPQNVPAAESEDFAKYQKFKQQYTSRIEKEERQAAEFAPIDQFYQMSQMMVEKKLGTTDYSLTDVQKIEPTSDMVKAMKEFMILILSENMGPAFEEERTHHFNVFEYAYNLDFDDRSVIGDDPTDFTQRDYGCNRVEGPDAMHGTHVAGIIGAENGNSLGIKGICPTARIMAIRCVPDGDEHDKDVANSIYYAVDNGAQVINMSFGKSYSPGKKHVDAAVKYAESKGVLLVHAAGNSNRNNDTSDNFPNDNLGGQVCSTWIEVGASGPHAGRNLPASFSNYGVESVDIFAPGEEMYSTVPDSEYEISQGTSMAAPVVAGAAALLLAYFPELSAAEVRSILLESATDCGRQRVNVPGQKRRKKFRKICASGGVLNVYQAVQLAQSRQ